MVKFIVLFGLLFLVACGSSTVEEIKPIEVRTIEMPRPAPVVPSVDQLRLRSVDWIVITPDNIEEKFKEIESGELVLFAVTSDGYENIALNLSDIRAMIEQQRRIIAIYQAQYK